MEGVIESQWRLTMYLILSSYGEIVIQYLNNTNNVTMTWTFRNNVCMSKWNILRTYSDTISVHHIIVVYMDCGRQWKNSGPSTFINAIVCSFRLIVKKNEKLTFLSNSNNLDINTINNKWNFQKIDLFAVPV